MERPLIDRLLAAEGGGGGATPVLSGETARVWRVEADGEAYAVKITDAVKESAFASESADARVYAARWSNLVPAYEHLVAIGAPVPTLFAAGALVGRKKRFQILKWLEGEPDDFSDAWFAAAGEALAALHSSRRPFQGWVAMRRPYPTTWFSAVAASLSSRLALSKPHLPPGLARDLERRAGADFGELADPEAFVFSHTDGLQGVFERESDGWRLMGVIDIEDHQFTDQRFVLAGFELGHGFSGRTAPDAFWRTYEAATRLDPTYERFRRLFQCYLLLVWTHVFRARPAERERWIDLIAELVR
jgi:Ser/Thr protein kinase RdoA (MazF antagonist)